MNTAKSVTAKTAKVHAAKDEKIIKDATITIRLSPDWEDYIKKTAAALTKSMETPITKTWVVTQLMKMGLPLFEDKHKISRKKKSA